MKNFISGKVETDFEKQIGRIRLNDVDLRIGEYICYSPAGSRMIVIEPREMFLKAMDKLSKVISEKKALEEKAKDEKSRKEIAKEYSKLEEKYRSQMSSSFVFIYRGSDNDVNMEVPRNCITSLNLEKDDITAIIYDDESLFLINPDDEWMYDEDGDVYSKRPFINILKNAM